MVTAYDELAEYYDLIHAEVTADVPFFVSLARDTGGPVLELGCGTGRTLIPLAEAGFQVVGLDNSPAMLARARERVAVGALQERVTLLCAEMASFDLQMRFPLVTAPFHTWMHLTDPDSQGAALRCIGRHLNPGGRLVLDLPAPSTIVEAEHDGALTLEGIHNDRETGAKLLQFASTRLDLENQILHTTWIYDRVDAHGAVTRTVIPMDLRYLYPHEAELLLEGAGLRLRALWGDYDRTPYSAASEKLVILAESPAA